ncbi:MAG: hypothetical protein MJ238_00040 [Bacilli bacterium]|nr:hypothetical protein [Bacilli bacterium]
MLPSNFRKKGILALLTAVASAGMLAACSDIEAKPIDEKYNAALVTGNNIKNNALSEIYDALVKAGDANSSKVLNNILYIYSQSIYGNFWEINEAIGNDAKLGDIASKYEVYGGDKTKVVDFYNEVIYRIKSTFLGYVQDSAYQERSHFIEKKFYDAQIKNYYDLAKRTTENKAYNDDKKLVEGGFRLSETYVESGDIILDAAGDTSKKSYFFDILGTYKNYIESNLLSDIYRNELTAQYIYSQNRSQIKLTAARKIETISLKDNDRYPNAVRDLVKAYCKNVVATDKVADYDFRFLDNINKGTMDNFSAEQASMAATILGEAGWTKNGSYYVESQLGTIMAQYDKLTDNRFDDDTAIRGDFTNSGAYTVETGLEIKTNSLKTKSSTNYGWYTPGQADGALPSSLSKRLFKVQVANEVDHKDDAAVSFKYGSYIGNTYYLNPETYEDGTAYPYAVYDSGTWYICKVEEAVKSSKISGGADSYNTDADQNAEERISRKIGYMLSSNDSYKSKAQKYYVNEMAIIYNDSHVYHYFKETFPDLFND